MRSGLWQLGDGRFDVHSFANKINMLRGDGAHGDLSTPIKIGAVNWVAVTNDL
jgi:hypothetical protein